MTEEPRLLDFAALGRSVRTAATTIGAAALVGAVAQTIRTGPVAADLLRWVTAFVALTLVASAVLVAWHAYRGADRAHRRGQRLAGSDVGLVPPRRPRGGAADPDAGTGDETRDHDGG